AECDPSAEENQCAAGSSCNVGVCDPETYTCVPGDDRPDGTPCGSDEVCLSWVCSPRCADDDSCPNANPCRGDSTCNPTTFQCAERAPITVVTACGDGSVSVSGDSVAGWANDGECTSSDVCRAAPSSVDLEYAVG